MLSSPGWESRVQSQRTYFKLLLFTPNTLVVTTELITPNLDSMIFLISHYKRRPEKREEKYLIFLLSY